MGDVVFTISPALNEEGTLSSSTASFALNEEGTLSSSTTTIRHG
ncbi:hypothetical protein Tco_1137812, partial [Tanacetum coccineum]